MNKPDLAQRHVVEWAWFLIGLGAILRFQGLQWDDLLLFNPDERNIGVAAALIAPSSLVPQFNAYNGLALYAPRLLAELIAPWTAGGGSDPAAIVLAGRILSALMSSLALPLLWMLARNTVGLRPALACLACAVFAPGLIQSAHFATTESGLVLCLVAILLLCERHVAGALPLYRFAMAAGVVLGLGFGLKTTALVFSICPVVAVTITTLSLREFRRTITAGLLSIGVVAILAVVTTPQLVFTPAAYFATMRFEQGVVAGTVDVFWTYQFTGARNVLFELSQLPWLLGPVAPPLAVAGAVVLLSRLWQRDGTALRLAPALAFAFIYAAIIVFWYAKFVRYLAPVLPVLILFCGCFVSQIAGPRLRLTIALVLCVSTGVAGLAQAMIYQYRDPRIAAWEWMLPRLGAKTAIVVEPSDVGPPLWKPSDKDFEVLRLPLLDPSSPTKVADIASKLAAGDWLVISSRRHHAVLPRLTGRFPEMCGYYAALWSGRLGYRPVAKFRRRPPMPVWADAETQAEETFTVFDSPEVILLQKALTLSTGQLEQAIREPVDACPAGATSPR